MNNNHGGKREGAGSGGPRPGAGRPRKKWDSGGPGTLWRMELSRPGALPDNPRVWRVLEVGDDYIEFQDTETEEIFTISQD